MAGLQTDSAIVVGLAEAKRDEFEHEKARGSQEIASSTEDDKLDEDLKHDGVHDGLEFPTDEERETLRRVADKIPWNAYRKSSMQCTSNSF
jgi:POT family proton-dependent oligopeptide transporter